MKTLNRYIIEKFQVSTDNIGQYVYYPKNKKELIECIKDKIDKEGLGTKDKPLNLNDIDTSKVKDMSELFDRFNGYLQQVSINGYFDISDWNVSNVENMASMFENSFFNGNLSDWDVSNVKDMYRMFYRSKFTGNNGDISDWNVKNVMNMEWMFYGSTFSGNISNWDVRSVENMEHTYMFFACPLEKNPPKWYI